LGASAQAFQLREADLALHRLSTGAINLDTMLVAAGLEEKDSSSRPGDLHQDLLFAGGGNPQSKLTEVLAAVAEHRQSSALKFG
jgi:hypothetical protein